VNLTNTPRRMTDWRENRMSEEHDTLTPEKFIDGMFKLWESPPPSPPVFVCSEQSLPVMKTLLSGNWNGWIVFVDPTHDDDCITVITGTRKRAVGIITRLDVLNN